MRDRFAPSPTGLMHLGHAFSALTAWDHVQAMGGTFVLRMEDIDQARCRAEFEQAIYDDLRWLGLRWEEPVLRQSTRLPAYHRALETLAQLDLCYPCSCSRKDISQALSAPQEGIMPTPGPDGPIYPGTCRGRKMADRTSGDAVRLDMAKAIAFLGGGDHILGFGYLETGADAPGFTPLSAPHLITGCGDIVLARKDIGTSYHLSVVVDDAAQAITRITRGLDMKASTMIHNVLQLLLEFPIPRYHHHRLIRDSSGRRLAKRHDALAISTYRTKGASPQDIRNILNLPPAPAIRGKAADAKTIHDTRKCPEG
jgi:glutamyl-Q tRNA(Asp) synthetase